MAPGGVTHSFTHSFEAAGEAASMSRGFKHSGATETMACLVCSAPLPPKRPTGPAKTYCGVDCRRRAAEDRRDREADAAKRRAAHKAVLAATNRSCIGCSTAFTPTLSLKQQFCTKSCARKASAARQVKTCATDGCDRPVRAKDLCVTHYNQTRVDRHSEHHHRDPVARRRANAQGTHRRRAKVRDAFVEQVDRDVVGKRDGWRCGICREVVRRQLSWPDPGSPSLDHIEPLSLGGEHSYRNTRIAHLSCNVKRGNRVEADQLALIG